LNWIKHKRVIADQIPKKENGGGGVGEGGDNRKVCTNKRIV